MIRSAALLHATLAAAACVFQLLLAAGKPWGHLAMGGKTPGVFPTKLRIAAVAQAGVLVLVLLLVLSRAGLALPAWHDASRTLIWLVVGLNGLSTLMNLMTPSQAERALWAPVATLLLASSLVVALG